jgi:hypothetical protein
MKKGDKLKPGSPAFFKRQAIWRHNSFHGSVRMAQQNMRSIGMSNTATGAAKRKAQEIWADLVELKKLLKDRNPI